MTRRHSLPLACAAFALLLPLAAQSPDPGDLAGKWMTSFGPMTLEASRKSLSGTYGFEGTSQVEGVVERDGLRLNWRHSRASGRFEIELWDDGDHFVGKSLASGGQEEFFAGYRMKAELPKPERGEVVRGQSTSGLNFHLRAPKKWNKRDKTPALVILHGSNMTAADYVGTIAAAWPKIAERYVLVGFDGEHMSRGAKPDAPAYNYTYVNFSGPGVGEPGRYNQTPGLLAAAMEELQGEYDFAHYLVGGHSQGGFLTWVMALHYPELVKGAFPMSCNLLVQCEPDSFDDTKKIALQHRVALAPIHGENDPVVAFSGSEYATRRMVDGGFPRIHFFTDPHAAHMFARLPVPAAIEWIEQMACTDDAGDVLDFAAACLDAGDHRDAIAALQRAEELGLKAGDKRTAKALDEQLTELVEPEATELLARIRKDADNGWVDDFLAFRRRFGTHAAAEPVMQAYAKLRSKHQKPADELFYAARGLQDAAARNAKYREIMERYYASKWYESVKGWID